MPLTPEERAEIARKNGAKSQGPKTEQGKAASRRNALTHGLRADALALPNEDPTEIAARADAWNDYYKPQSPAAQHLVNACVAATLMSDRCRKYHDAALSKQVRDAANAWEEAREERVEAISDLLWTDPRAAVLGLARTAHGCRHLIGRWEALREALVTRGVWTGPERDEAIRLQGLHPETAALKECPEAWLTRYYSLLCHEEPADAAVAWMFQTTVLPDLYLHDFQDEELLARDDCQQSLLDLMDARLAPLRDREAALRTQYDEPDLAGAADRALILHDGPSARLFLRYHAEARSAFQRAYGSLVKVLEHDVTGDASADSPNEPTAPEAAPAADDEPVSPNEPEPAPLPGSRTSCPVGPPGPSEPLPARKTLPLPAFGGSEVPETARAVA